MRTYGQYLIQILEDFSWALDPDKTKRLLIHIFSNRKRLSTVEAIMWGHVVKLFWHQAWTKKEIAQLFGCDKANVKRIIREIRREAKKFDFSGQEVKHTLPDGQTCRTPLRTIPTITDEFHWEKVLASYDLYPHEKRRYKGTRSNGKNPTYIFKWPLSSVSGYTYSWSTFFDSFEFNANLNLQAHTPTFGDIDKSIDAAWRRKRHRSISQSCKDAEHFLTEFQELETTKLPRVDSYNIIPIKTAPRIGLEIKHPRYGRGWVLRTTDDVACCDFIEKGRINLSLPVAKEYTGVDFKKQKRLKDAMRVLQTRILPAEQTADNFFDSQEKGNVSCVA
jgi:hypothetical protein